MNLPEHFISNLYGRFAPGRALRAKFRLVDEASLFETRGFGVLLRRGSRSVALWRFQIVEALRFQIGGLNGRFQALEDPEQVQALATTFAAFLRACEF